MKVIISEEKEIDEGDLFRRQIISSQEQVTKLRIENR
jgi:hypothetical protein